MQKKAALRPIFDRETKKIRESPKYQNQLEEGEKKRGGVLK